jgi:hypothetical protein
MGEPMLGFATLLWLGLTLYALLDVLLGDAERMRLLRRPVWVLVVLLVPVIGPVAWLLLGRPPRSADEPGGASRATRRPGGDDPRRDHPSWGSSSRDQTRRGAPDPRAGGGRRSRRAPRGPDDDPEFLRELDERLRRQSDEP